LLQSELERTRINTACFVESIPLDSVPESAKAAYSYRGSMDSSRNFMDSPGRNHRGTQAMGSPSFSRHRRRWARHYLVITSFVFQFFFFCMCNCNIFIQKKSLFFPLHEIFLLISFILWGEMEWVWAIFCQISDISQLQVLDYGSLLVLEMWPEKTMVIAIWLLNFMFLTKDRCFQRWAWNRMCFLSWLAKE